MSSRVFRSVMTRKRQLWVLRAEGAFSGGPKQLGEHVLRDGTVRVAADAAPLKQFFQHSAVPP